MKKPSFTKGVSFMLLGAALSIACVFLRDAESQSRAQRRQRPFPPRKESVSAAPLRASNVRLKVYDARGQRAPKSELTVATQEAFVTGVYPLDVDLNPLPAGVAAVEDGFVTLADPAPSPLVVHFYPRVEGFGQVKIFVDNGGKGYVPTAGALWEMDVPLEAARSRIAHARRLTESRSTTVFRKETLDRLNSATNQWNLATKEGKSDPAGIYRSLSDALWASEMATLDVARDTIARSARRNDFHFGLFSEGYEKWKENQKEDVRRVFDYATILDFFISTYEDAEGNPKVDNADGAVSFVERLGMKPKGHPLIYLIPPNFPPRLRGKSYEDLKKEMRHRVLRETKQFRNRIKVWDILNEGHFSNVPYTHEQIVDLARVGVEASKEGDPRALTVINVNHPIGDYVVVPALRNVATKTAIGTPVTPYRHLKELVDAGVPFDVVGIQMYYWGLDMMELSRLIDRFAKLGKPIHITEVGVPSAPGVDRGSQHFQNPEFIRATGEWHRPWNETTQADWVEQFYTVAYSKRSVQSITWASFTDQYWPYGGLAHRSFTLKQSYWRLKYLLGSWGFTGAAPSAPSAPRN